MFGKLSLIFLVCLTVSVIGQEFHCSRTNITNDLLTECTNAVRYNSDILQATCHKNTKSYPPYKKNAKLQAAAQAHAEDMARNRFFSHSSYDGTSWYTRIESFGYKGESGENIARNYNTAFASLSTWYCSSGHRKSLLACKFDEIGSGLKCTKDRGCYAVQVFGCSTGKNCCETTEPTKPISSTVPPPSVVPSPSVPIGDSPPPSPDTPEPPRSPPTDSMEPSPSVDPPPPEGTSCSKTISNWKLLTQCLNEIRLDSGVYFSCRGSSEKLRALKSNPKLQAAAQAHAEDMSKKDYFSHSSRDGSSPSDRAKALGYSGSVGENIAWNYNTVYKAMHEWLCSSGHRANILSCKYDEIGSGVYCGGNGCYSVQKFGCSTGWDCCETAKIDPPPASTVPSPSRSPSPSVPIGNSPPPSPDTPEPPKSPPAVSIEPSPSVDPPSPPEETSCSKTISNWKLLTQCLNEIRLDSGVYFSCRGSSEKLRALKSNPKLQAAAQAHAEDMSKKDYFSHSSRDGSSPSDRAKALGYSGSVGENIAWNYNNVYKAFDRWLCSSGHRANILSCKYDEIGSGVYCGGNGCYSVQKFGCSTGWDCCETAKIEPPPASTVPLPSSSPSPSLPIEDSPSSSPDTPMPPRSPPTDSMEPSPSADPVEPPSSPDDSVPPKSPPAFSIEPSPSVDPPSPPEETSCSKTISNWKLLTQCLNEIRLDSGVYFSCRGSSEKLRALKSNPKLQAAAQAHAEDMSKKDYFSHSSRDGSSPSDRAKALGYSGSVGENIAWNYNNVYKAFDRWLCSSGHRANILSCKYDEIGSGVYCGGNGCYSVQKFGCSTGWDCCETAKIDPPPASTVPSPSSSPSPSVPIKDSPPSSPDTPRSPPTDSIRPSPSGPVDPPSSPATPMRPRSPPSVSIRPKPSVDPPSSPATPMRPRSPPSVSIRPSPPVYPVDPPSSPVPPIRPRSPPVVSKPPRSPNKSPTPSQTPSPSDKSPPMRSPRYKPWWNRYRKNRYRNRYNSPKLQYDQGGGGGRRPYYG